MLRAKILVRVCSTLNICFGLSPPSLYGTGSLDRKFVTLCGSYRYSPGFSSVHLFFNGGSSLRSLYHLSFDYLLCSGLIVGQWCIMTNSQLLHIPLPKHSSLNFFSYSILSYQFGQWCITNSKMYKHYPGMAKSEMTVISNIIIQIKSCVAQILRKNLELRKFMINNRENLIFNLNYQTQSRSGHFILINQVLILKNYQERTN